MIIDNKSYTGDGSTRQFNTSVYIASNSHIAVFIDNVLQPTSSYDLLGSVVLFNTAPSNGVTINFIVSDTGEDLPTAPNEFNTVSNYINNIIAVSNILDEILGVESISTEITGLFPELSKLQSLYADKTTLDGLYNSKTAIDSLYSIKAKLESIYADKTKLDSLYADKATLDAIYTKLNNIATVSGISSSVTTVAGNNTNVTIVATNIANVNTTGSNINNVNTVATNISNINNVNTNIASVNTVSSNISGLIDIVNNLAEILQADDNATIATQKATDALNSANNASASATQAYNSSVSATTQATNASASANTASAKASEASISASSALSSKNSASTSESNALTYSNNALNSATQASSSSASANASALLAQQYANNASQVTGYNDVDDIVGNKINAIAPFSGYMAWKENNFYFKVSSSFLASIADTNRYIKFGDKVVDTYGEELLPTPLINFTKTNCTLTNSNEDYLVTSTASAYCQIVFTGLTIGKVYNLKFYFKSSTINKKYGLYSGAYVGGFNNNTSINEYGYKDYIFTAGANYISISFDTDDTICSYTLNNFSLKQIQSKSATDYIPEVTVLDQSAYGLTTQSSVNAGDYVVVDRKELVTNGTFDNDISGWTTSYATWNTDGTVKVTGAVTTGGYIQQILTLKAGKQYIVKYDALNSDISHKLIIDGVEYSSNDALNINKVFISDGSTTLRLYVPTTDVNRECFFDNISVKQVDEVYRAKRNTAEMYDYTTDDGIVAIKIGDIVKLSFNYSNGGIANGFYKRVSSAGTTNLSTWDYSNTTYWSYLGTASNMNLLNPYFEVRDNLPISNQIAFLHTMDATTKAYEGITNEILFNDALAIETPKAIMLKNGYSEVSKGLYSKGSKLYVFAGYWQTLNKGGYHPVWNMAGCGLISKDGDLNHGTWYTSGYELYSTSDPFLYHSNKDGSTGSIARGSWRPDNKYYDIIYPDQFISFESSELAYKPTDSEKKRIREYEKYRGVEGSKKINGIYIGTPTGSGSNGTTNYIDLGSNISQLNGGQSYGYDGVNYKTVCGYIYDVNLKRLNIVGVNSGRYLYLEIGTSVPTISGNIIVVIDNTIPFNSKGTSLTTDLIGSPTNYPTIMKDRLAEGKGVFGVNPLLVGQDGTSYLGDIPMNSSSFTYKEKVTSMLGGLRQNAISPLPYTWQYISGSTLNMNYISNNLNAGYSSVSDYPFLVSYTSQNNPYQATTPKAVASVEPKVIASNSHSIYKGAIIGNCIGKVQVGNGSNGYESKVLENNEVGTTSNYNYDTKTMINNSIVQNTTVIFHDKQSTNAQPGVVGMLYLRVGNTYTALSSYGDVDFGNNANWKLIGVASTPTHSTIALDNANSPASKWFEGICYDDDYEYPFVVMEELAYNTTSSSYNGDDNKFTVLTNGTVTDANNKVCVTKFMIGNPIGRRN